MGASAERVVVDGYKRVRALRQLKSDTVLATAWDLGEADALVLERLMRVGDGEGPLEQGWLLRELETRFSIPDVKRARRTDPGAPKKRQRNATPPRCPDDLVWALSGGVALPRW